MPNSPFIIIQARLASTRLPDKIILDFHNGKGILEIIIERIKHIVPADKVIVATSTENKNDAIQKIAEKTGVNCFAGDENNVLKRFIDAAMRFNAQKIIRICSDNPFLDIDELKRIYDDSIHFSDNVEYASFWVNEKPSILTHYGLWTEYVTLKALKKVNSITQKPLYQEHVTNYIHQHPNEFHIHWLSPSFIPPNEIRLTTDSQNDFIYQKMIFKEVLNSYGINFSSDDIFQFLEKNRNFIASMKKEINQNAK